MFSWMDDALCREMDSEMFFPGPQEVPHAALKACSLCKVSTQCLEYALEYPVEGVFGGTTTEQRKRIRGRMQRSA